MGLNDFLYQTGKKVFGSNPLDDAEQRFRLEAAEQNLRGLKEGVQQGASAFTAGASDEAIPEGFQGRGASGSWNAPPPAKDPRLNADGGSMQLPPEPAGPPLGQINQGPKGYVHAKINGKDWVDYTTTASDPSLANTEPSREIVAPPTQDQDPNRMSPRVSSMMEISGNNPGAERLDLEAKLKDLRDKQLAQETAFAGLTPNEIAAQRAAQRPMDSHEYMFRESLKALGDKNTFVANEVAKTEAAMTPEQRKAFDPAARGRVAAVAASKYLQKIMAFMHGYPTAGTVGGDQ